MLFYDGGSLDIPPAMTKQLLETSGCTCQLRALCSIAVLGREFDDSESKTNE